MADTPETNADFELEKPQSGNKKNSSPKSKAVPGNAAGSSDPAINAVAETQPPVGTAENLKSKAKEEVNNFKTKATDGARAAAEKGKDRATEAVASLSKLIRDSAATIDENVGAQYGNYARSAADSVDGFANKMEAKDVDQLVGDARDFVRKSPAVAIGAAAAIGFVLARLVRSGRDDA